MITRSLLEIDVGCVTDSSAVLLLHPVIYSNKDQSVKVFFTRAQAIFLPPSLSLLMPTDYFGLSSSSSKSG